MRTRDQFAENQIGYGGKRSSSGNASIKVAEKLASVGWHGSPSQNGMVV